MAKRLGDGIDKAAHVVERQPEGLRRNDAPLVGQPGQLVEVVAEPPELADHLAQQLLFDGRAANLTRRRGLQQDAADIAREGQGRTVGGFGHGGPFLCREVEGEGPRLPGAAA